MKMHWCTGRLNLSGQDYTIIVFEPVNPISWPEAQVLMALHGEENVFGVKPCAISDVNLKREKERLLLKYGFIAEKVFPGYMPRMETLMPGESEDQPAATADEGFVLPTLAGGNGNGHPIEEPPASPTPPPQPEDDDENGDDEVRAQGLEPPAGPAIFKPGKHQPPRKGA